MDEDLMSAFGKCSFKGHKSRLVIACNSEHSTDNDCGVCVCVHRELLGLQLV